MKKIKQILLFFLLVFLSFNVYGGFWVKAIWVADGQLIYDGKNGYFFLNGWHNNIFDISSKVYLRGFFHSIGSSYDMPLKKTIRLNDATFFSFGERYELDEIDDSWGRRVSFTMLKYKHDGEILFSKEIKENEDFGLVDLMLLDDKIKVIGRYEDENKKKFIVILTLSENGELLKSKLLSCEGNHYSMDFWNSNCVKVEANHYGIIINGSLKESNNWYNGVLFIELNKEDEIKKSKFYFDIKQGCWYFNQIIKKDSDSGFSILLEGDYYNETDINNRYRLFFLKLDSDWNMKWSKEYTLGGYDWIYPVDFFEDQGGYTIGIRSKLEANDIGYYKSILLKINKDGNHVWCKKYNAEESISESLSDVIGLPNGGIAMSNGGEFVDEYPYGVSFIYILNNDGEVPRGCHINEKVEVMFKNIKFDESTPNKNIFRISNFDISLEDVDAEFFTFSNTSYYNILKTFCEYLTIQGKVNIIIDRSILGGYYIHKINFSVDSMITPYIKKFKIYGKFETDDEYVFVTEVIKEEDKPNYEVEVKQLYSRTHTYKIVAVNPDDEIVDIVILGAQD